MTTEDDFQLALDKNPTDWQTRLVFADWLQERDDPRAEGYRVLGTLRLAPDSWITYRVANGHLVSGSGYTTWGWGRITAGRPYGNKLRGVWFQHIVFPKHPDTGNPTGFATRREADDGAAIAYLLIPTEHRYRVK